MQTNLDTIVSLTSGWSCHPLRGLCRWSSSCLDCSAHPIMLPLPLHLLILQLTLQTSLSWGIFSKPPNYVGWPYSKLSVSFPHQTLTSLSSGPFYLTCMVSPRRAHYLGFVGVQHMFAERRNGQHHLHLVDEDLRL